MDNSLLISIFAGFLLADAFLLFFILWARRQKSKKFDKNFYLKEWQKVVELESLSPASCIIMADKLFDNALKDLGYEGGFVDKFRPAQNLVRNAQPIWDAHKVRNRIAHESGFHPTVHDAISAVSAYRSGLKDLGAL